MQNGIPKTGSWSADMEAELLTPKELAQRLKVSERSVIRMVKGGVIPARVVVGKIRLSWPAVLASLPPVAASRVAETGVTALDLKTRLRLNARNFYRNTSRNQGGAA